MAPGRPRRVTDGEILSVFDTAADPVLVNKEVVEEVDLSKPGVYKRLEDLLSRGYLDAKEVGQSAKVYWITDEGREFLDESD